jgi:hypothetical protein
MNRRCTLPALLAILTALGLASPGRAEDAPKARSDRPNVVIILADDRC